MCALTSVADVQNQTAAENDRYVSAAVEEDWEGLRISACDICCALKETFLPSPSVGWCYAHLALAEGGIAVTIPFFLLISLVTKASRLPKGP